MTTPNQPTMTTYIVTARTPRGSFDVEIPTTSGPDTAARRAVFILASQGYGDLPDIDVIATVEGTFPEPRQ